MATTIDHLEAHFRYTVIRGFTDAKGVRVPFEASGVIRRIDLVMPQMSEIAIDWEREGPGGARVAERLTFLIAATDGPRNNHMKEYFEKGDLVMPPREPKQANAAPPAPPANPRKPATTLGRFGGRQPREEILLGELTVACDCRPAFHRPVLPVAHLKVHACLRCGAVTLTRQVGDDGRFHGEAWTASWAAPTDQRLVDWLGRFPRVLVDYSGAAWRWPMSAALVRYPRLLYPADTRVADEAELKALESTLREIQAPLSRAHRLAAACGDIPPAPANLPEAFGAFGALRRGLDLHATSDAETLRAHAHLLSASCELAADRLLARDDAYARMMGWLRSKDEGDFSAGIAMLRDSRRLFSGPEDKRLTRPLLEILYALPLGELKDAPNRVESWLRFEALLVAIADLGVNTPEMLDGLGDLGKKLARNDAPTADAMRIVINELTGVDNRPPEYR